MGGGGRGGEGEGREEGFGCGGDGGGFFFIVGKLLDKSEERGDVWVVLVVGMVGYFLDKVPSAVAWRITISS